MGTKAESTRPVKGIAQWSSKVYQRTIRAVAELAVLQDGDDVADVLAILVEVRNKLNEVTELVIEKRRELQDNAPRTVGG